MVTCEMGQEIKIEQASHEDAKLLRMVLEKVYEPFTNDFSPTALHFTESIITQETSKWLIARCESEIVGAVRYELYDIYLDFHFLCVTPSFRKKGIAHNLFLKLKEKAYENKKKFIKIVLRDSLKDNHAYFKEKGFYYYHKYHTNLHSVFILKLEGGDK
ncbi:GNAT family N-acetyltransferase [Pantoea agglomerans]|uniref:GNAT family N-acetyltransferase n=1 Tax=Enterobacter agglomerans TaxID=549 RepID=UPI003C7BFE4E